MRVILSANESVGYDCLKILLEEHQEVVGVITDKTTPETKLKNARLKALAKQAGIEQYEPENINDPAFLSKLQALQPDVQFNVAYVRLFKAPLLNLPKRGCINFHPGPLPRYGGSNGWVWAIINNEQEYGVVFHEMKERIDSGDILAAVRFPIEKDETGLSLLIKCYKHGAALFRKTLTDMVRGTAAPLPQNLGERSYYFMRDIPFQGMIDVTWSAAKIDRFVRALSFAPFPNPLSQPMIAAGGARLIVAKSTVLEKRAAGQYRAGEVVDVAQDGIVMQTGDGAIQLR
ncbi:MAG TPA: methionyl-tRNA formyltransferase, partial [Nitrospirota bacterium]|nr:methionyl-tRNA formyltransferase [Nitrospirota bacterium]